MIKGMGVFDFEVEGEALFVDDVEELIGKCEGKILITKMATPDIIILFKEARAVLCEYGGLSCHLALLAREVSLPCGVGITGLTSNIRSGEQVRAISSGGTVFVYENSRI